MPFAQSASRTGASPVVEHFAYLLRNRRTTATAPMPVASNAIVAGSGTEVPPVLTANAGSDDANIVAANRTKYMGNLFIGNLLISERARR